MLKSEIDNDEFFKEIYNSSLCYTTLPKSVPSSCHKQYTNYIIYLCMTNPSIETITHLTTHSQDNLILFVYTLKYIIKNKIYYLKEDSIKNVFKSLKFLYDVCSETNTDLLESLIINSLRLSNIYQLKNSIDILEFFANNFIKEIENEHEIKIKDFFILFFIINDIRFYNFALRIVSKHEHVFIKDLGRDFVYRKFYKSFCLQEKNQNDIKYEEEIEMKYFLEHQTQKQFLISKISTEIELNIIFFLEKVKSNHKIYLKWLIDDYITSVEIAKDVLRFLVAVFYTTNLREMLRLIIHILETYGYSDYLILALFFDKMVYIDENYEANPFIADFLSFSIKRNIKKITDFVERFMEDDLYANNFSLYLRKSKADLSLIEKVIMIEEHDVDIKTDKIYEIFEKLDYRKYTEIIKSMKLKKIPMIDYDKYREYINNSQSWDGYMQVFLWKILAFQKIIFKYDIEVLELNSMEAKEGYEILKNIKL